MTEDEPTSDAGIAELLGASLDSSAGRTTFWVDPHDARVADLAHRLGLVEQRRLHQMRVRLPLDAELIRRASPTRPLRRHDDAEAWIITNNAAFHWHPDQGGWTTQRLLEQLDEQHVDDADVLVLDDPLAPSPGDGGLGGFCWTKLHADVDPPLGEIYVIAAHPDLHGRGYGRGLTVAGLQHLRHRYGVTVGMLYVEADNAPAVRLYESMGFAVHHDNVAYARPD